MFFSWLCATSVLNRTFSVRCFSYSSFQIHDRSGFFLRGKRQSVLNCNSPPHNCLSDAQEIVLCRVVRLTTRPPHPDPAQCLNRHFVERVSEKRINIHHAIKSISAASRQRAGQRDLVFETATLGRKDRVQHFNFLSPTYMIRIIMESSLLPQDTAYL